MIHPHPPKNRRIRAGLIGLAVVCLAIVLGASSCNGGSNSKETKQVRNQLGIYLVAQPVPQFSKSQLRQNLIEIETAQANTTVSTSFFFNLGVADPINSCSSIGFPIPSTAQLTSPDGKLTDHNLVVSQMEATGVYTGDSSGTYVICTNFDGTAYAQYWEGYVDTVTGPATWDAVNHKIVLSGTAGGFTAKVGG